MKVSVRIVGPETELGRAAAARVADAARRAAHRRRVAAGAERLRDQQGEVSHVLRKPGSAGFDLRDPDQ